MPKVLSQTIIAEMTAQERDAINLHMREAMQFQKLARTNAECRNWQRFAAYTQLAHACVQNADAIREAVIHRLFS